MIALYLTGNSTLDVAVIAGGAIFILMYAFFQIRDASRPCPQCGNRVKTGVMVCPSCKHDFRQ